MFEGAVLRIERKPNAVSSEEERDVSTHFGDSFRVDGIKVDDVME